GRRRRLSTSAVIPSITAKPLSTTSFRAPPFGLLHVLFRALTKTYALPKLLYQHGQQSLLTNHDLSLAGHPELDPATVVAAPHLALLQQRLDQQDTAPLLPHPLRTWGDAN